MALKSTMYVVRRRWFRQRPENSVERFERGFATREGAEAWVRDLDLLVKLEQKDFNPFGCDLEYAAVTSLPAPVLADWLLEAEITPPKDLRDDPWPWYHWWEKTVRKPLTDLQFTRLWEAVDRFSHYEIVEVQIMR